MRELMWLLAASMMATSSCSWTLDWDPDGLKCRNNACDTGYSCLGDICVADSSLARGETCNADHQCRGDLICTPRAIDCDEPCADGHPFTCQQPCDDPYEIPPLGESVFHDCGAGQYCKPYGNDPVLAVCVESEGCQVDGECIAGDVCVAFNTQATACLVGCELDWRTGYNDNCGGAAAVSSSCQPLGRVGAERLVCLSSLVAAQGKGSFCRVGSAPCERGLACVEGLCVAHCDVEDASNYCTDDARTDCCPQLADLGTTVYGICITCP